MLRTTQIALKSAEEQQKLRVAGALAAGGAHFVLFGGGFDGHGHRRQALFLTDVHGIKRGYF